MVREVSKVKNLSKFLWIYIAFLLQSIFLENLKIFSCSPDLVLTLVIIFSVTLDFTPAALLGAFAGLLIDVMYESVFGINLLVYMFLAILVGIAADRKNENSPLIMSWISFVSVAALEIALAALKSVIVTPEKISVLCANIFVKGIFAAVFALLFVLLKEHIMKIKKQKKDSQKEAAI